MEAGVKNRCVLVRVRGIVQGVGFRPFIFQLARRYELSGWVRNQSDGVEIEAAGLADGIDAFLHAIPASAPPLARIVGVEVEDRPYSPGSGFEIVLSDSGHSRSTLIAPDVCTCGDCLRELFDPRNRRYRYPFINCTNCGPRYTIIQDIPYDREKTTMARFTMCPVCREEYENPLDRRFHAQPNACWTCGPQVWLEAPEGPRLAERDEAVREAARHLAEGAIVAIKGLGGFHLAVDAFREEAVRRLRRRKIREEKPFAVMFPGTEGVRRTCVLSDAEAALLESPERPIVLLRRRRDATSAQAAPSVAPGNGFLGSFLPYTPLHALLFEGAPYAALVMTSGNQSDEPIVMSNEEARERLRGIADVILFHDRDIHMRCDDSVTRVMARKPCPVRRARGTVPVPVFLRDPVPPVLAVGAELKNTVCLTRGREAFLSQHIGDLENLETLRSFELTIEHLERILEIHPQCIVHDLHPDYLSSQWAACQTGLPRFAVQHHHAHIASVMAEQKLAGPVLGFALDGTGYGTDGTLWGGEVLRVDGARFERLGHLRQVPLPGGAKAVKEPWRMALSFLWSLDKDPERSFGDLLSRWPQERRIVLRMLDRRLNAPLTSSCGRLFDAVAALAGIRDAVTYEGQAAIELEQSLDPSREESYTGEVRKEQGGWIMDPLPMVREVVGDVRAACPVGLISARFHNGLIALLVETAERLCAETSLRRIALSGGVFQNAYLLEHLQGELLERGFEVTTHTEVPANDACIALGQAWVGGRLMADGG